MQAGQMVAQPLAEFHILDSMLNANVLEQSEHVID